MINRATTIALLALPAFALGACNKGATNTTAANSTTTTSNGSSTTTTTTASTGTGGAVRMEPGEWEMSIEAAGLPGGARTTKTCITPEMADRQAAEMANPSSAQAMGMNCDRSGLQMDGGRMNGTVTCTGTNGQRLSTTIHGEITSTSVDMRQQTSMTMGGQSHDVDAHITGRRTGECSASTPGAGATTSGNAAGGMDNK